MKKIIEGKLQGNERGFAFLIPSNVEDGEDLFIAHGDLRGAMHGDFVQVVKNTDGLRTNAKVIKILERGISLLIGVYTPTRTGGFVMPDEKRYFKDIFIRSGKGLKAKNGDKVVCKILSYPKNQSPEGIITEILGRQFDRKTELKCIYKTYNLPLKFPKEVEENALKVACAITEKDLVGREDYRKETVITIDGASARDFDDAVSVTKLKNGNYKLGVHIADVSHYVKKGSPLDREAFIRATSVYFPESVIPMLPEKLCNDVCSLVEGKDRLTFSCVMEINSRGEVVNSIISPSVINSTARMTYDDVFAILEGDKTLKKKYKNILKLIENCNALADILITARDKRGSIELEVKESEISVGKNGEIFVEPSTRNKAHIIIEEFMLKANATVAEYMFYLSQPFIYRVHGKPTDEKLEDFYAFLKGLGINVARKKDEIFSKDFQKILSLVKDKPVASLVNRVMLRSMRKAEYSPVDIGHFGLSLEHYCHFTSPIRRYPDLAIHRILRDFLSGKENLEEKYFEFVKEAAKQSSLQERNADEAERAVDDYYKALYIQNFEGEEFDAVISGVTSFGVFAELTNGVEGLIKIDTLSGSRYIYDEKRYTLSNGKTTYKLGQNVKIKVVGVNLSTRKAEFQIV